MALHIQVKYLQFQKNYQTVKSERYDTFLCFQLVFWRQNLVVCVRQLALRSPGAAKLYLIFSIKYAVNFSIVFIFISYEGKDFYGVVSVGQLSFLCFSYYGRSHHMLGGSSVCM